MKISGLNGHPLSAPFHRWFNSTRTLKINLPVLYKIENSKKGEGLTNTGGVLVYIISSKINRYIRVIRDIHINITS